MARRNSHRADEEAKRRSRAKQRIGERNVESIAEPQADSASESREALWASSRSGARAGRGFRFQDLAATLIALTLWRDGESRAQVIPEGYDDISLELHNGSRSIQVKSRRESVGDFTRSDLRRHLQSVAEAWVKRRDLGLSTDTTLLLERSVAGIRIDDWLTGTRPVGSVIGHELSRDIANLRFPSTDDAAEFAASLSIAMCPEPLARAVSIVAGTRDLPEAIAEIVVAAVCDKVGMASDTNADSDLENRSAVSVADIDVLIDNVLASVDLELLDEARSLGVCEAIDWTAAPDGSDVRRGAHVGPAHVAAGLLVPRPNLIQQVMEVAEMRRLAVITGPSGSGKSALAYATVHEARSTYRWQRVERLTPTGRTGRDAIALLLARVESLRPSRYAPVGILIDDAGRHEPEVLDRLLRRLVEIPNVVTVVSIREEDRFPVPLLSTVAATTPRLDDSFAQQVWKDYAESGLTSWEGWREPAERAGGHLLEYVTLLTEGADLETVVSAQVRDREIDPSRHLELEILRIASCANQYGVGVPAVAIQTELAASHGAFTAACRRLVDEHLVVEESGGLLRPLHETRSAALARASHPFGADATVVRLVAIVPPAEVSRFLRRALESEQEKPGLLEAAMARVASDHRLETLIAVTAAFRTDGLRRRARVWKDILDECGVDPGIAVEAFMMSRLKPHPDTDELFKPEFVAAVSRLRDVPTDPDLDAFWRMLDAPLAGDLLASAIEEDRAAVLIQAITVLRGIEERSMRATASAIGAKLAGWSLGDSADILAALRRAGPALADEAVTSAGGEQLLLSRIVRETPWLATLERVDERVEGAWIFVDEDIQPDQNDAVVAVCRLALALAPTAELAKVSAVDALGRLVKIGSVALVDKAIPRENLVHSLEVSDNRAQARALSREYGARTLTSKLAAEARAIAVLTDLLPAVAIVHLSDRQASRVLVRQFEAATALLPELDAPAEQAYADEVPGALGDYPVQSTAVTVIRSLLQNVIPSLARAAVADRAPARTVAVLDDLAAKIASLMEVDRYRYLTEPPDCGRLLESVRQLRVVASASASADGSIRASMRAAASHSSGLDSIAAAAKVAVEHAPAALQKESARMVSAIARSGYDLSAHPSPSHDPTLSWPPGDLAITVEGVNVLAHLGALSAIADAARGAREHPDRRVWIGLRTVRGYVRSSIFQVTHDGVLPLGDREAPSAFAGHIAPTPVSSIYDVFLKHAHRLSSLAAIVASRGSTVVPDDEGDVFRDSWAKLGDLTKQVNELAAAHPSTEYVAAIDGVFTTVRDAVVEDLARAQNMADEGTSGWRAIESLLTPTMLDRQRAALPNTDAAVIYGTAVVISDVEDDFLHGDERIAQFRSSPLV